MKDCVINGSGLTIEDVVEVARFNRRVVISEESKKKILKSKEIVNRIVASGVPTYGISTGFGEFSKVTISKERNAALQKNLILSHACGVGDPFPEDVVRGIILLRLNTLASGYSGVTPEVTERLADLLNHGITPHVPRKGSLGSSGDLANLAHVSLVILGEGQAYYKGELISGAEALKRAGLTPVELSGKDALALTNGTQVMTSLGALAVYDAENLLTAANMGAALTFEAFRGITAALDPRIHRVRPHQGQSDCAAFIAKMLAGSSSVNTREGDVQDPYTLRCVPQVHGAAADAIAHVRKEIEIEMNSVTDNPLVFPETGEVISGGNFHGEPIAVNLDFLGIAISELANISERRTERLVNPQLSGGLPAFLIENGGVNSGYMIPQYTAACLVSENKVLAHPASVDSITSSANKEDHVSMGTTAARKLSVIVKNVRDVLAIEWMVAAQACDLRKVKTFGAGTAEMQKLIRENVAYVDTDRVFAGDIARLSDVLFERKNLERVTAKI